jgi:hypothetical protein
MSDPFKQYDSMKVKQLKSVCVDVGVPNFRKLRKAELVLAIKKHILSQEIETGLATLFKL